MKLRLFVMRRTYFALCLSLCVVAACSSLLAQQSSTTGSTIIVPQLIRFAGMLKDSSGHPLTGIAGLTFSLYRDQEGGAPLWLETQNVALDAKGRYDVLLGAEHAEGVPMEVFTSGEARWLGVQAQGQPGEQPRVLLVSVPYALKAADASTLGGLPASAFVLAARPEAPSTDAIATNTAAAAPSASASPLAPCSGLTSDGTATANQITKFTTPCNIEGSKITDNGTTASIGELLSLPSKGTATATAGQGSQALNWTASSFNSGTATAVNQNFRWQAEAVNNNSTKPSGTLNLLFGQGTATPAETGFKFANNGLITFAAGQTFPGTGTVKSVGLAAPASDFTVSGSPVTSSGTLTLGWKVAPTNLNTASAIVKRDASGSFSATNINSSGQITVNNGSSVNPIISFASAANAAAIVGSSQGTGLTDGVQGSSFSTGQGSAGVIGLDQNNNGTSGNYTTGVTGVTQNSFGVGVLGYGTLSNNGQANIGFSRAGVWGDEATGTGVAATSDGGTAVSAINTSTSPTLKAVNNSTGRAVFAFNTSTSDQTMYVQNNTTAATGVIFRAEAPQVQVNGSTAFCQINTRGGLGCTGDVYQNLPANGLVKALLYVDPSQPSGSQIVRCFNSTIAEPTASTPPCGFTFTYNELGSHLIDFGFTINNRFLQGTAVFTVGNSTYVGLQLEADNLSSSSFFVETFYTNSGNNTDTAFYLTVF
jgi:hypothetical protein